MNKILNTEQIKAWDQYTILNERISSINLMERAATACVDWLKEYLGDNQQPIVVLCGKGNNGGDGLSMAYQLAKLNYQVQVYIINHTSKETVDFLLLRKRKVSAKNLVIEEINSAGELVIPSDAIIIDAILGSGLNKPLFGLVSDIITYINKLSNTIISIDVPTGLPCEITDKVPLAVQATHTLTFEIPKLSMLFSDNFIFTGEVHVLKIGLIIEFNRNVDGKIFYITAGDIKPMIKPRKKFDHKGTFGHALLLAGSYGKMGAAVLSAKACLRSGVGLLTVACPKIGYNIIQTAVPEAMAYTIEEHEKYVSFFPKISNFKSIGIGPGLERRPVTRLMLRNLMMQSNLAPLVIDADGINLLSEIFQESPDFKLPADTILTPHVREFDRLAGNSSNAIDRYRKQLNFSEKHKVYIVLKGAYSCITTPNGESYFNSTGNPGMATAGTGDVLTGMLTGLRAQGYSALETCIVGVYLHGKAGDIAAQEHGEHGMIAGDVIQSISKAFGTI